MKGYFTAKNSFVAEVTFKVTKLTLKVDFTIKQILNQCHLKLKTISNFVLCMAWNNWVIKSPT